MENDHPLDSEPVRNAATHYRRAQSLFPQLGPAESKALQNVRTARLNETVVHFISEAASALRELHLGAAIPGCDWKREYPSEPEPLLDKYMSLVQLGQVACLRARQSLNESNTAAAFDDLADVLSLSRHVGGDGLFMSRIIQVALEGIVVDLVAARLLKMDSTELRRATELVNSLSPMPSLAESMQREKEFALNTERARALSAKRMRKLGTYWTAGMSWATKRRFAEQLGRPPRA